MRIPRHLARRTLYRRLLVALLLFWTLRDSLQYLHLQRRLKSQPVRQIEPQSVYVASTHWNNAKILKDHWNGQIIDLVKHVGSENVFVSVYESGSWDDSKTALRQLQDALNALDIPNSIVLDPTTHKDEINARPAGYGWIDTPRGRKELRRIPYLANLRNKSLEPLAKLYEQGQRFDKILFLNDVVFDVDDVLSLLATNDGAYAAACALDFSKPPSLYDTFAMRDLEGHEPMMPSWPYFRSRSSRDALIAGQPVPVASCWNGMVVMEAEPFYGLDSPLRFRGIPDSLADFHLEGSECCLIYEDNPLTASRGVWVNPDVQVGYNKAAYDVMRTRPFPRSFPSYLKRIWENRLRRWFTTDWFTQRAVKSRLSAWEYLRRDQSEQEGDKERGAAEEAKTGPTCLINEMQVLVGNGWAHV